MQQASVVDVDDDLRDLRDLSSLSLQETCSRARNVIDISRLSRAERGVQTITDEQRRAVLRVLRDEIVARAGRIAKVLAGDADRRGPMETTARACMKRRMRRVSRVDRSE